ncbi:hypothetical protein SAMN02745135_01141 [Caloranaerobacter azorensis DSM 13643]|uniref:Uncharacterized protein n=1 Tax=Caloranaerobacter azorensis DSM 13643 TaxID=1121264 RepID=A0A1M5TUI6_9FIRM|nr:hypothetical protein [Caloranaerobacter azorensis]SHH54369.1 hypothetical protein SAMN02745135_01141 [Caloranaerobacter azorensis DSM 13643]
MNKREIIERIEELKNMSKAFELLTDDRDEEELLTELEGLIDELIFFYKEKLDKVICDDEEIEKHETDFENLGQGWEYYLGIGENIPSYLR